MGLSKLLEFIRSMKRSSRLQIYGDLFAVDEETGELCGCALGQGVLNLGVFDEEKIRKEILFENSKPQELSVFNPLTNKKELRKMYRPRSYSRGELAKAAGYLHDLPEQFRYDVVYANDRDRKPISDIAASMYTNSERYLNG